MDDCPNLSVKLMIWSFHACLSQLAACFLWFYLKREFFDKDYYFVQDLVSSGGVHPITRDHRPHRQECRGGVHPITRDHRPHRQECQGGVHPITRDHRPHTSSPANSLQILLCSIFCFPLCPFMSKLLTVIPKNKKPPFGGICKLSDRGDKGSRTPDLVTASHAL